MRISLKKFTRDPYKYAKKAPLIILLGDDPAFALIPYVTYKERFIDNAQPQEKEEVMQQGVATSQPQTKKPHGRLYHLLFS